MNQLAMVAGGVIAVYVILALIVSQVVEWINTIFNTRGRVLYAAMLEMLSATRDPHPNSPGAALVKAIYEHPLVGNLGMKKLPSYIPPRTFTLSLISSLRDLTVPGAATIALPDVAADGDTLLRDLQTRVQAVLPATDPLRRSLGLIIEQTGNDYDAVLKAIDNWYQAQMDRATGTFKRYATCIQIALALVIVWLFRIDTFAMIASLGKSAAAQTAIGAAQTAETGALRDAVTTLLTSGIIPPGAFTYGGWYPTRFHELVGLGVTWFAVLLGAPFWFDVLKNVVPVRLSGAKPDAQSAEKGDKGAVTPHAASGPGAQAQA